ncbi:MAG TPA: bifunctional [glutamine synthetase] adenylyltransferase/[glutamine synthetase]-adenylyl-L-tyrosine phosphorylase [Acidimicrobiales bacterium]|nr:bifunctional [glutamine synthetase] adenylyltransferase/[glutamine synthetase]-adenylyl-L-tyrosine phosphorylase [Acidimicrobiales bacterium]
MSVPAGLAEAAARSAAPDIVQASLQRLLDARPEVVERLGTGDGRSLGATVVAVMAASNALGRLCVSDTAALGVLGALEHPVPLEAADPGALARAKRLELLRIAARDLLGLDPLEDVGRALAELAEGVLSGALTIAGDPGGLSVIGMGKLGGSELNYASDVDVVFVTDAEPADAAARRVLEVARAAFRVDTDLRPEGRAGALTRSLAGYRAYWERWATTWEFQALLKARAVAGDPAVGRAFEEAAARQVWDRTFSADELGTVRAMKARTEDIVTGKGLAGREIKRGPGGIRDVEFAVQLLQLVHGRSDPGIRDRSTLGALGELGAAGYVAAEDAAALHDAYRFLRTLEHRLQLVEEEQTHAVPVDAAARRRIALVMGFVDDATASATQRFDEVLRRCQHQVRAIHERLFFRPLLEAFAAVPAATGAGATVMSGAAVQERLAAFGFSDPARTRAAVTELAGGLTRSSRLMDRMLPLLLDWLSRAPDPDLGLLGLRNLVLHPHQRTLAVATFRDSPEAARRVCLLLGSSRTLSEAIERNPELIATVGDDAALAPTPRATLVAEADDRLRRNPDEAWRRAQLVRVRQDQVVRIAARDIFGLDDVAATGRWLTQLAEALLQAALDWVGPPMPFAVIGMGRLGGAEMSYASDLDVLLVFDGDAGAGRDGEAVAEALLHAVHGPSPAHRVCTLDLGLRPEGGQGRLARDLAGYGGYFERWAETWERQALVRARPVAGDAALGERFMALVRSFVWDRPFTPDDAAAIRRMKARIERERISAREDPQFHLKLGRGSLSDVEWTVQLLQLQHGIDDPSTLGALDAIGRAGALGADDVAALGEAYRFCEHTRNRWHLVGALPGGTPPGDALPAQADQLSRLARSLETTPSALRDDYRRVTRRARRVVERAFYGITNP